jgi:hypothetical protein
MFGSPTVNLNALCNWRAKIACCSSGLVYRFLFAGGSIQNASEQFASFIHLSIVNSHFWMLLHAQRNPKINSDEQHTFFAHGL